MPKSLKPGLDVNINLLLIIIAGDVYHYSLFSYNRPNTPEGQQSTLTGLESQLMNMFQRDFLALLGTFQYVVLDYLIVNTTAGLPVDHKVDLFV